MQVTETLSAGPEARIPGGAARGGARGAADERARDAQGQGPDQRLPARQGAGRASAPGLRPLGHGRRGAERRQRGEPQDRRRQRPQARPRAADRVPGEQGRASRRRWRPRRDLAFTVALEVLPSFELADFSDVTVDEAGRRGSGRRGRRGARAHGRRRTAPIGRRARAQGRRRATASWSTSSARIDGEPFEGGTGEGIAVELGSGTLHPGLRGAARRRQGRRDAAPSTSTFPENYGAAHLAGKAAEFDVTVKEVQAPGELDDRRRARQGLRHGVPRQAEGRRARRDPARLRRPVAAASSRRSCSTRSTPSTPSSCRRRLVEQEFAAVWSQVEADMKNEQQDLRRRGHDRGGGARRVPQDRRAPRAPRPGAGARSASRPRSRSPTTRSPRPSSSGPASSPARRSRSGSSTGRTRRRWPRSARRSSRRRSSTTCSAQVKVAEEPVSQGGALRRRRAEASAEAEAEQAAAEGPRQPIKARGRGCRRRSA